MYGGPLVTKRSQLSIKHVLIKYHEKNETSAKNFQEFSRKFLSVLFKAVNYSIEFSGMKEITKSEEQNKKNIFLQVQDKQINNTKII